MTRPLKHAGNWMAGISILFSLLITACTLQETNVPNLIPLPAQVKTFYSFVKTDSAAVFSSSKPEIVKFVVHEQLPIAKEGYRLTVDIRGIELLASDSAGLFYGQETLRQLYTPKGFQYANIEDAPRFKYRGLHLDVSRHFFDKQEVFKLLDAMATYKLNNLHLHLTDAGGWRIEIDKYPRLTANAAYRTESDWRQWWDGKDRKYLPTGSPDAYGGYYTKQDIREIVSYAKARHINILPEIEFPGHSEEVLFAYPELSCSGQPYQNGDFCIGNPQSIVFMQEVLDEIIELFPSEYIHVGGDEAGKQAWKTCPKCQALMRQKGMSHIDELQSYMIHKAEEHLISRGRKLIGWDEILEGGLAPEATVMSWRGEEGGIKAARMGHDVIMTPGNYMYFDFYQADPKTQPYAIGGYTPIKKVYSYNPIPVDSLTEEESRHILGVQANTWTEYIPDNSHLEYMMFPRALAVAEIAWSPQEQRSWDSFKPRMNAHIPKLQQMGINTFTLSDELEVTMNVDTASREITVFLDAEKHPAEIRYTTDGSTPTSESAIYDRSIVVKDSAHIVAALFREGELQGAPTEKKVDYHRAIGKTIKYHSRLYPGYMAGGTNALIDGYRGGLTYLDGRWQGYLNDLDCVIDMGEITTVNRVSARFMQLTGPGVFQPGQVEVLTSRDGVNFTSRGIIPTTISPKNSDLLFEEYKVAGEWSARYVRVKATEEAGGFIFLDEIIVW